ncbi:MAG: hypothetical protein NTY45_05775 [Elusimicrobia bacterium]|nr:hypothetical protein [Elusimicrobiota bacterium]
MRTIISVFVLSALAIALGAQAQAKKPGAPAFGKNPAAIITAQAADVKKAKAAPAAQKKQADTEPEEGTVMIDSKAGAEETERYAGQPEGADAERGADVPGGLPSSYGQCKGVMNEGGRTILIFESLDDGAIYFVQVNVGKSSVSWKLVDRILRSAD